MKLKIRLYKYDMCGRIEHFMIESNDVHKDTHGILFRENIDNEEYLEVQD